MADPIRPDLLFARLQLRAPNARSILVTAPREDEGVSAIAQGLAVAIVSTGSRARLLDLHGASAQAPPSRDGIERMDVLQSELNNREHAARVMQWPSGFTVVASGGVLESAPTITLAATVDAVVLLARAGQTMRGDLVRAREDIEGAGGVVVGSILLS